MLKTFITSRFNAALPDAITLDDSFISGANPSAAQLVNNKPASFMPDLDVRWLSHQQEVVKGPLA